MGEDVPPTFKGPIDAGFQESQGLAALSACLRRRWCHPPRRPWSWRRLLSRPFPLGGAAAGAAAALHGRRHGAGPHVLRSVPRLPAAGVLSPVGMEAGSRARLSVLRPGGYGAAATALRGRRPL